MPIAKKGQQKISILNKTTVSQCFVLLGIISLWHYHNQHAELIEYAAKQLTKYAVKSSEKRQARLLQILLLFTQMRGASLSESTCEYIMQI